MEVPVWRRWCSSFELEIAFRFAVRKIHRFHFILTLYSRGNVIAISIVDFTNNWFMTLSLYVYLKINAMKSQSASPL